MWSFRLVWFYSFSAGYSEWHMLRATMMAKTVVMESCIRLHQLVASSNVAYLVFTNWGFTRH